MPANLDMQSNGVASMFYYGETPWHKDGVKVEKRPEPGKAFATCGANWAASKKPLFVETAKGPQKVEGAYGVVREDTGACLGIVRGRYEVLQNKDLESIAAAVCQETGSGLFDTGGALFGGRKVWLTAKAGETFNVKGKDAVDTYFSLLNAHDGTMPLTLIISIVRIVCSNTFTMAKASAESVFKIRHTSGMGLKIEDARQALGIVNKAMEDFKAQAERLASVKCDDVRFEAYLQSLGFNPDAESGKERVLVEALKESWASGPGAQEAPAKGTLWGAFNAITNFTDNVKRYRAVDAGSAADNRMASILWGPSADLKDRALDKALSMAK